MVDNVAFPLVLSYESIGGPVFSTQIVPARSNSEIRNATVLQPRREWTADLMGITRDQFGPLLAFWIARQGRYRGFRFQDPTDYWAVDQPLAATTGSTSIQLTMTYADTVNPTVRNITRPVQETTTEKDYEGITLVRTYSGTPTTLVEGADYTVDYSTGTGLVTLAAAVIAGQTYAWTGEFDCAARFNVDKPNFQEDDLSALSWKGFAVIEILEPDN